MLPHLLRITFQRTLLLVTFCAMATSSRAQDGIARSVVLGETVEFTITRSNEAADFETVSINVGGKLLKQFATPDGGYLNVVATFNGHDGDYVLLRTSMGQGACAGGNLYALRFHTIGDEEPAKINVVVSPVLTTCLGEWPPVKFSYAANGGLVINVSGHELRGDTWSRWIPERKGNAPKKRKYD